MSLACPLLPSVGVPQNCRLYATKHLRVLLRANVEFFSNWGIELLVTQLHDRNKTISMEALDILDEACEDKVRDEGPECLLWCLAMCCFLGTVIP